MARWAVWRAYPTGALPSRSPQGLGTPGGPHPIRPRYVVQATPAFSDMVELAYNPNTEDRRIVIWRPAWITQKEQTWDTGKACGNGNSSPRVVRKVYMDYNATTPLEPEVIQAVTEAMKEAWGNPSSSYVSGRKAKDIINAARASLAKMIGGKPQDIIFTSGGTESNNLVIHSMVRCFHEQQTLKGNMVDQHSPEEGTRPHFITCTVEHDSIRLPLEHLVENQMAEVTFVPVSKVNGQAEVEDILAAVRPTTCLVTIMLANNETGVIMPVSEISRRIKALNQIRAASGLPRVLVHTDAAALPLPSASHCPPASLA